MNSETQEELSQPGGGTSHLTAGLFNLGVEWDNVSCDPQRLPSRYWRHS